MLPRRVLWLLTAFLATLSLGSTARDPFAGAVLGVDLRQYDVVVALFENDIPKIVAQFNRSAEYVQTMEKDFLSGRPSCSDEPDNEEEVAVIVETLHQARLAASEQLGSNRTMGIGVVSYPGSSYSWSGVTVAALGKEMRSSMRCRRTFPSASMAINAYGPFQCFPRYRVMGVWNADDWDKEEMLLGIDVLYDRAILSLFSVSDDLYFIEHTHVVFDTGVSLSESVRELARGLRAPIEAVIINGDVDDSKAEEIKAAVIEGAPQLAERFEDPVVEYKHVASIGAACKAREMITNPSYLHDHCPSECGPSVDPEHDEL